MHCRWKNFHLTPLRQEYSRRTSEFGFPMSRFDHTSSEEIYDALKAPKQLVKFTSEDGAENHCQSGALAYKDEVVFNWLDEALKVNGVDAGAEALVSEVA
jgi:hypothetical protein